MARSVDAPSRHVVDLDVASGGGRRGVVGVGARPTSESGKGAAAINSALSFNQFAYLLPAVQYHCNYSRDIAVARYLIPSAGLAFVHFPGARSRHLTPR